MTERIVFKNGVLKIKVFIEGRLRSIPIKMKKMIEDTEHKNEQPFLLTTLGSEDEPADSRVSEDWLTKI
jgi:hypothetical protein